MKLIVRYIQQLLLKINIRLTKSTNGFDLDRFLKLLEIVKTEYELIRIGDEGDGGYLLPNDIENISGIFSPGVGNITKFEEFFISRNVKIYMADNSVDNPFPNIQNVDFVKKHIGMTNSNSFLDFNEWIRHNTVLGDDYILQMDIEGSEFKLILHLDNNLLILFRTIVIEIHSLDSILDPFGYDVIFSVFDKLLLYYDIVHIHPNNCCGYIKIGSRKVPRLIEVTFHRKDRSNHRYYNVKLPNPLDSKNVPDKKDIPWL